MLNGRDWYGANGATQEDLAQLRDATSLDLPQRYLDLLAFSNGGEGALPISPYNLCLDPAQTVAETFKGGNHQQADLDGFLIFGGNGGGEYLAFDLRGNMPWPVVSIDMVAGASSAQIVATNFDAFFDLIGVAT